jgi:hypothetical protein
MVSTSWSESKEKNGKSSLFLVAQRRGHVLPVEVAYL